MRFMRFTDDLCLVEQTVTLKGRDAKVAAKAAKTDVNINHILIYDRSYSMSYELPQLGNDLIEKIKELPIGDVVTLGYFSGERQFNFMLKGFKITDKRDFKLLEKEVMNNLTPIGCTCFSEILTETDQVIKDLSVFSEDFSLTFFTDGYPVVSNYQKEIANITKAIAQIEGKIASGLFVGYGNYYNKELMARMAGDLGGSLIHCSSLSEYKASLGEFMTQASESGSKVRVKLETDTKESDLVFGIKAQTVVGYSVSDDNTVSFSPKKTGDSYVNILTKQPPKGAVEVPIPSQTFLEGKDPLVKAAYGSAFLLTQRARSDVALEILGVLGDKALIDQVNNAFTLEEYGKAEAKIKRAVTFPKSRFAGGRDTNYLPAKDAFCVVDAIEILLEDNESSFLPYHDEFKYRRIGVAAKSKEKYPTFTPDYATGCPFSSLTWNQTKLNLSVLAKIKGTVEFKEGYSDVGFQKNMPTFIHRNYAIVKDGFLNVGRIPVMLAAKTRKEFESRGLLEPSQDKDIDILCLEKIPVINRVIAEGKTSAKELCRAAYQETELIAELKALKFLRNEIEPQELKSDFLTDEQIKYLKANGIGKNGFSPPTEKEDPKDFYFAKEFQIKIAGLSSLPSIKIVREKIASGKNLTASAQLIQNGLDLFKSGAKPKRVQLAELDDHIATRKAKLFKIRKELQRTKFAILLASKWFDEFDSRKDCTLTVDGNHFTIGVREVKVNI